MKFYKLIFCFVLLFSGSVLAMPDQTSQQPHDGQFGNTGIIDGQIFTKNSKGEKKPLANQQVTIVISKDDQQVLTLDKTTDKDGKFVFKNIIKNPSFTYQFGAMVGQDVFLYPKTNLGENEDSKTIEFWVGEGSPHQVDMSNMADMQNPNVPSNMMPPPAENAHPANSSWSEPFMIFTAILCAVVSVLALYFAAQKKEA